MENTRKIRSPLTIWKSMGKKSKAFIALDVIALALVVFAIIVVG